MPNPVQSLKFIVNTDDYQPHDAFVARLPAGISKKRQLLNELYERLSFPGYFGFNWDALWDCLCDFHWVKQKKITIIHGELPHLNKDDLKIYISILRESSIKWNKHEEHDLEIIFPEKIRENVMSFE